MMRETQNENCLQIGWWLVGAFVVLLTDGEAKTDLEFC
jgi:hypothetical protein